MGRPIGSRRTHHYLRARRPNDSTQYGHLVQASVRKDWPEGLLIAFRPAHFHHPRGKACPPGRRVLAGCATPRRTCLDRDHTTLHRRRQRRPAPAGGAGLTGARYRTAAFGFASNADRAYAINIVETVTWLAGRPD